MWVSNRTTLSSPPSSLDAALAAELAALRANDLERTLRVIQSRNGAGVETTSGPAVDFSSNDYLGLASDPRLAAAIARAAASSGSGAAASRLIAGNTAEHEALDADIAAFLGAASALSFSTGYAANTGAIPALVGRGDAIFADELNHASLIDGCRLSRATVFVYPHADMQSLAGLLEENRGQYRRAMVVTDGMFSMDGDLAPLADIVALSRQHDAWSYVDDAHAIGVLGDRGRGTAELLGVLEEVDVLAGTLGKAFGAAGAFVAGSAELRSFLVNRARSFVFSTGPMPSQAAAGHEALRIVVDEPERRHAVAANAARLRRGLLERGVDVLGEPDAHIVPVVIGDAARTMAAGASLAERGFLVGAVRPPTVPPGTSRLRLTVSAAHTHEQIDRLAAAVAETITGVRP